MVSEQVKLYGKTELALKYGVCRATFMSWLYKSFTPEELEELNYDKRQHIFTKKQMEIIFKKIGKP